MANNNIINNKAFDTNAVCFWSWNDLIEKDEIRRQMQDFAQGRFNGVVIHSRCGLRIRYMGEEWFESYRCALEEAERLGMEVWIYDEDGWPSGFAGGAIPSLGEKHWLKALHFSTEETASDGTFVAAWRHSTDGYVRLSHSEVQKGDLVCRYTADGNYVDLMSYDTVSEFINYTYETYKKEFSDYFGNVVKGFFTDEPQIAYFPWGEALKNGWRKKYDEDITDNLYKLVVDSPDSYDFRIKYRRLASDLFFEAYTKQISDWCGKNGLMLTGHFAAEDGLFSQKGANCGVMRHYTAMQLPGIDHLGNRITSPVLAKQVSSIANQLGKHALSETFGCAGWNISFDDIRWIWGYQSVLGINKPCFHLSAYSMTGRRKRDYPAFFSYQEPWWDSFPDAMAWINNLDSLMSQGRRAVEVLVISPLDTVMAADDEEAFGYTNAYRNLLENLLDNQIDFEIGDETVIAEIGCVENGTLRIGNASYGTVIVSGCMSLRDSTVKLLDKFAAEGGYLTYCESRPEKIDFSEKLRVEAPVLQNRRELISKWAMSIGLKRSAFLCNAQSGKICRNAVIHVRQLENSVRVHVWTNESFASGDYILKVRRNDSSMMSARLLELTTLKGLPVEYTLSENEISVKLRMSAKENYVVEITEASDETYVKTRFEKAVAVAEADVRLCLDNALTLDYAQVSVNGGEYSEKMALVRLLEHMFEEREKYPDKELVDVAVRYDFSCASDLNTEGISVAVEAEPVNKIEINGSELTETSGWWIDRKISEYEIGKYLRTGQNEIILHYSLPCSANGGKCPDGFESERNRFYLPVEPESIYIKGDFDIEALGSKNSEIGYYTVENSGFLLVPQTPKKLGDITCQGSWFYRGNVSYKIGAEITDIKDRRIFLTPVKPRGTGAEIIVNGLRKAVTGLNEPTDITDLLVDGKNSIEFCLLGNNRNLMGPHHHIRPNAAMVGPDTFVGKHGFEDFVSPDIKDEDTWQDLYSFVPFGCDGFVLIYERKTFKSV